MFTKKSLVTMLIIAVLGVGVGFVFRYISQNGVNADTNFANQKIVEIQGKVSQINNDFILNTNTKNVKILSSSPSLDLKYFLQKNILASGFYDQNVFVITGADIIK